MEANAVRAVHDLGLAIERGDDLAELRRLHQEVHVAVQALVNNVQEFKLNTITQLHKHTNETVPNDWFITPFDAYVKA